MEMVKKMSQMGITVISINDSYIVRGYDLFKLDELLLSHTSYKTAEIP